MLVEKKATAMLPVEWDSMAEKCSNGGKENVKKTISANLTRSRVGKNKSHLPRPRHRHHPRPTLSTTKLSEEKEIKSHSPLLWIFLVYQRKNRAFDISTIRKRETEGNDR